MGIGRRFRKWLSGEPRKVTFSEPMPIDEMFRRMFHSNSLDGTVTREEALSVPAVLRGRNRLCSIATLPLVQYDADTNVVPSGFLKQIDKNRANVVVLAETIEDLVFEQVAWWRITEFYSDDYPKYAERVEPSRVNETPDKDGNLVPWIDGKEVDWGEVIKFESPNPGLLCGMNGRVVSQALRLERMASLFSNNPRRYAYFTPKSDAAGSIPDDTDTSDQTVIDFCNEWNNASWERTTGYVPGWLEYHEITTLNPAELQLIQRQERAALDIANALGIDPEDVGVAVNSDTYQNAQERRQDRVNTVLAMLMRAITDRLSMGDVTKAGNVVQFDLDGYLQADPKTRMEVQTGYLAAGVITKDEIRREERMGPLPRELQGEARPPLRAVATVGDPVREIGAA